MGGLVGGAWSPVSPISSVPQFLLCCGQEHPPSAWALC